MIIFLLWNFKENEILFFIYNIYSQLSGLIPIYIQNPVNQCINTKEIMHQKFIFTYLFTFVFFTYLHVCHFVYLLYKPPWWYFALSYLFSHINKHFCKIVLYIHAILNQRDHEIEQILLNCLIV